MTTDIHEPTDAPWRDYAKQVETERDAMRGKRDEANRRAAYEIERSRHLSADVDRLRGLLQGERDRIVQLEQQRDEARHERDESLRVQHSTAAYAHTMQAQRDGARQRAEVLQDDLAEQLQRRPWWQRLARAVRGEY